MAKMSRKKSHGARKRKIDTREQRSCLLIICEGKKTEPNYFKSFDIPSPNRVITDGEGYNTLSLVERTKAIVAKEEKKLGDSFDQVWCVFDKDNFPQFTQAISNAQKAGFFVAYSNEAFELWFLLHLIFLSTALGRDQYADKINEHIHKINPPIVGNGWRYKKNYTQMYDLLINLQPVAINNAKRLIQNNPDPSNNPSTTVYRLVEELNKLVR